MTGVDGADGTRWVREDLLRRHLERPENGQDIFELRGIDRDAGCMVVVRPDQYIAQVLPIDGHQQLATYFDRFMLRD